MVWRIQPGLWGIKLKTRHSLLLTSGLYCFSGNASAHVKWFAKYDLLCPPRSISQILFGEYFLFFCLFVVPLMFAVIYTDRLLTNMRCGLTQSVNTLTALAKPLFPGTLRLGVGFFFIAASSYGIAVDSRFILTPELLVPNEWITNIQLVIALLVLLPATSYLAGIGIIGLYVYAIIEFGTYHLLDYPIFIGVAVYLIIQSLLGDHNSSVALTIVRLCTGITLLWGSIEKFAYPEWSFALLNSTPEISFGLDEEFYMVAAGFVEFCAAFLLIVGMLAARVAALVLIFFFVWAIGIFGIVDAIGHSVIVVLLVLLSLADNPLAQRLTIGTPSTTALTHSVIFVVSLCLFVGIYCGAHYLKYQPYNQCESQVE